MTVPEVVVFATINLAVVVWALAEVFASRVLWTTAAVLAIVHSATAFALFYDASHAIARLATMRQTAALTGIEFSGGIYLNYLFLAVWAGDALWWWLAPRSRDQRPGWVAFLVRGFIFFIILNGAVIFADGWARIVGAVSVVLVATSWFLRHSSRRGASITAG